MIEGKRLEYKEQEDFPYMVLKINEGILFCEYKSISINYREAVNIVKSRYAYTDNVGYPVVVASYDKLEIDKLAMNYFKSAEGVKHILALAMVYQKSYTRILINFLLKFYSPKIPMKIFTDEKLAVEWIKSLDLYKK